MTIADGHRERISYAVSERGAMPTPVSYPDDRRPFVSFDTTVLNRLVNDGEASAKVIARIRERVHLRLTALSINELTATRDPKRREALLQSCDSLIRDNGSNSDCLMPHNDLIDALILDHYKNPSSFDWRTVEVRNPRYCKEIIVRDHVMSDTLAAQHALTISEVRKRYRETYRSWREEYDSRSLAETTTKPRTFREALSILNGDDNKGIVILGKAYYDGITESHTSLEKIEGFIVDCPPFRALLYALQMSQYDLVMRDLRDSERYSAGNNDLFMAVYLPYCDEFVTDEKKGEQGRSLKEIVAVAGLTTAVLTFDEFCAGLLREDAPL